MKMLAIYKIYVDQKKIKTMITSFLINIYIFLLPILPPPPEYRLRFIEWFMKNYKNKRSEEFVWRRPKSKGISGAHTYCKLIIQCKGGRNLMISGTYTYLLCQYGKINIVWRRPKSEGDKRHSHRPKLIMYGKIRPLECTKQ